MAEAVSLSELSERIKSLQAEGAEQFAPAAFCFLQRQQQRLAQLRHTSPRTLARLAGAVGQLEQQMASSQQAVEQQWNRETQPQLTPLYEQHNFKTLLRQLAPAQPSSPLADVITQLRQNGNHAPEPENRDPLRALLQEQEGNLLEEEQPVPQPVSDGPRELKALTRVRAGQQQQRKRRRIEDALTHTPSDAGPLNSHRLVTRAITALQELSPAYLDHFVTYVDTLMVLEKAGKKRGG
ncbi:DUF2894 domain-containing protein [Alcanivorax sp. S6407]|uniref:DUF2894 domain-containing protein n=1 Tax=Alcanivorax sp. S6407 TaxID=2926424 RepID=UPI001FF530AB|nr:DUF2894 domain-containing protein [Alcanivorax sp. S6407]MCK0154721.1 DUF2894 domain-containing protein [Alcanivorax sp. S6407]